MAFPGDRAIKQHPRGVADQFVAAVLAEGEICILMDPDEADNWEIRVGDGVTPGGIPFVTKAYVDFVAGNDGVQLGTDELAAAGIDTEQRSWPATAFGLFAKQNNALLSGSPTRETAPSSGDASLQIATTGWVAANFGKLTYLGSNQDETDFPIGYQVMVNSSGQTPLRNQSAATVLRLSAIAQEYIFGGGGTALAGTWRSCGRVLNTGGDNSFMMRRVL